MSDTSRAWTWRHAILHSSMSATTRHVLLTISCFMNDVGGGCYPTTKQLAEATGLSERAICTHISKAVESGWLKVSEHGFRGRKWKNHEYHAAWPIDEGTEGRSAPNNCEALNEVQHIHAKALNVVPEGTEPDDRKALNVVQSILPYTNPTPVHKARGRNKVSSAAFETWWQSYPHKVGKAAARKAFEKAVRTVEPAELLAGVERYVHDKPPDRSWCNPATWLNQERWTDQPATSARPARSAGSREPDGLLAFCAAKLSSQPIGGSNVIEHE